MLVLVQEKLEHVGVTCQSIKITYHLSHVLVSCHINGNRRLQQRKMKMYQILNFPFVFLSFSQISHWTCGKGIN
uniref:Uncharacterized protein n=1 Tax=Meloidogyne enterolobii TaxID=390850 RepID=A0A6V7VND1_MELEN|nr:unnamed protein product [Meloidogyne enterolobii]